jgi:signal transduction histidine kinase
MKNFNKKIVSCLILISLLLLPLPIISIISMTRVVANQNELLSVYTHELLLAKDLQNEETRQHKLMPAFMLTGDLNILKMLDLNRQNFNKIVSDLDQFVAAPAAKRMIKEIKRTEEYTAAILSKGIEMKRMGASVREINGYFSKTPKTQMMAFQSALDRLVSYSTSEYVKARTLTVNFSETMIRTLKLAIGTAAILYMITTLLLLRLIRQKTEYDRTNADLAQKEKQVSVARKEAVEIVAHDLKSPLSAILISAQLVNWKWAAKENIGIKKYFDIIEDSAHSMNGLVNDLLDNAKIEAGNLILNKKACDLQSLLNRTVTRFEPTALNKEIRFEHKIFTSLPCQPFLDERRIEQVISNIISNALKFTKAQGIISISLSLQKNDVCISVTDTGLGMTKQQMDHVFERYWQVSENAARGVGLGLSISKAIIDAHEGNIRIESKVGKGSTFFITLPHNCDIINDTALSDEPANYILSV